MAMQYVVDTLFVQMGNITSLRRCLIGASLAEPNSHLNSSDLFPDDVCQTEDEIARAEAEHCASQPG